MFKIAIDAGHGLITKGKETPNKVKEWSFNNKVVRSMIDELKKYENVQIVRLDDSSGKRDVPLTDRTNLANTFKADLLVSIHHNAFKGKWGEHSGSEIYHYPNSKEGKKIADHLLSYVVKGYGLRNRGVKSANFHMLRKSKMTAVLIEGGFMDSTIDIQKLGNDQVLINVGKLIVEGLAVYYKLKKKKVKKEVSGKLYKVQTGAFSKKENADQLVKRLKKDGYDTYIVYE